MGPPPHGVGRRETRRERERPQPLTQDRGCGGAILEPKAVGRLLKGARDTLSKRSGRRNRIFGRREIT